jgi:hypothetical protein
VNYESDVLEGSFGEFKAAHGQKYQDPANFLQALWNEVGPAVGSMKMMLELMKDKFEGDLAGIHADLTNISQQLIDFLIEEVGEDVNNTIKFINKITHQLNKYDDKECTNEEQGDPNALPPDKGEGQNEASKTQGMLPVAPEANPAEGTTADTTTMAEGDKEETQSLSMVSGG